MKPKLDQIESLLNWRMPDERMAELAHDPEFRKENEKIADRIIEEYVEQKTRNQAPYDGILGCLPDWVPLPIVDEFENTRYRVLNIWGYNHKEALSWLNHQSGHSSYLEENQVDRVLP